LPRKEKNNPDMNHREPFDDINYKLIDDSKLNIAGKFTTTMKF